MEITFRHAELPDLEKIVGTYNSVIPGRMVTADLEVVRVESKKAWFDAHSADKRPLWVVLADGEYAGWISFNDFYGRPAYDQTAELSIYLEEAYRGKGIGKKCLMKALETAPKLGVKNILGFIFIHNKMSLRLFYSFGFEKWGHYPGVANMQGELRDLIVVGIKL